MRKVLKVASLALALSVIAFAGLTYWGLPSKLPSKPQLPGTVERGALEHGGRTRTWFAYVSTRLQAHPTLVIALHASMSSAGRVRQIFGYDFDLLAEEHGFIAVYPQGCDGDWNDCYVKGPFAAKIANIDDVGFLHALVDRLVRDHDADRAHVYVTGVSNGGAMAIRLALQTPDFARAYAIVISSMPVPENMAITPKGAPVSLLLMNGTADLMHRWGGGWTAPGKCNVTLITIHGGGHSVPHPARFGMRLLGNSNRDFHAADEIWKRIQQGAVRTTLRRSVRVRRVHLGLEGSALHVQGPPWRRQTLARNGPWNYPPLSPITIARKALGELR